MAAPEIFAKRLLNLFSSLLNRVSLEAFPFRTRDRGCTTGCTKRLLPFTEGAFCQYLNLLFQVQAHPKHLQSSLAAPPYFPGTGGMPLGVLSTEPPEAASEPAKRSCVRTRAATRWNTMEHLTAKGIV